MDKSNCKGLQEEDFSTLKMKIKDEIMKEFIEIIQGQVEEVVVYKVVGKISEILDFPLSVRQFAILAGKSESCVYKMCQREQIPYTKKHGKIYINIKDVNYQLLGLDAPD